VLVPVAVEKVKILVKKFAGDGHVEPGAAEPRFDACRNEANVVGKINKKRLENARANTIDANNRLVPETRTTFAAVRAQNTRNTCIVRYR
jgi:hypothetical protein